MRYKGIVVVLIVGLFSSAIACAWAQTFWPQWALNSQHTSQINVAGQSLNHILAAIEYDPLVLQEKAANQGELLAHYQVPLIDNATSIFMEFKTGTYNKNRYDTQTWGENGFHWVSGQLLQMWSFVSDW